MKKITRTKLREFIRKQATEEKTLDVGAGDKNYVSFFPNITTIDINPERKPDVVADVCQLPFGDNEFGLILCTEVLEHLPNPAAAIKEIKRVLKPGGKLVATTRFIFPIHDAPGDYFRYTKYGLRELFKDWKIEYLEEEANSLETIAVLLQRLIFQAKFKPNKLIKGGLWLLIKIFQALSLLKIREFGNINQTCDEKNILTSGYYLIARKI